MADTLALRILRYLPRNLLSRGFGWLASWERPRFFVRPFMRWFARRFGIDLSEAALPFEAYPSLLAMFTRELRPGARVVVGGDEVVASPVDARVGAFGRCKGDILLQAKGMEYSLAALLGDRELATEFERGAYATLYLSPRDYHRIHAPHDGTILRTLYEPGTLWPVNPPAVRTIPSLFAVNERITSVIESPRGLMAVVMVGATNVGSMRLAYEDRVTNRGGRREAIEHRPAPTLVKGQHLATFELGSTVVLLLADPAWEWDGLEEGKWLPFGSAIARQR